MIDISPPFALEAVRPQPQIRLPLLVTGIAGVVGYSAFYHFQRRYPGQVIGIRQVGNEGLCAPGMIACDAENDVALAELFAEYQFPSVLDCAGNCALRACELDPAIAYRVNVEGVRNLLPHVLRTGSRLVHLSVDMVFSGQKPGGYIEEDPTDPVTMYGRTMVEAERVISAVAPHACIARISIPMGISCNGHAGAIDWVQSRFKKNRPATLYFDEWRTPTYVGCLSRLWETLLANEFSGIYHTGTPRPLSLYQIGQVINRVGGYDPKLLGGCPRVMAGPIPPRAGNVSMNSSKLIRALGYNPIDPWPWHDDLLPTHKTWHFERDSQWQGSQEMLRNHLYVHPHRGDYIPPALSHASLIHSCE